MSTPEPVAEISMDAAELYREDVFTDRKVGTIRRMTPVNADGSTDESRPVLFMGSAQILTPAGALPISFELEADDLADAVAKFAEGAQQGLEQTMEEIKEMQRQASSSIVVPKGGMDPGMGGPMGGAGGPGGGIQIP